LIVKDKQTLDRFKEAGRLKDSAMTTEYRTIPGFDGYEFGSDGSIWSYWNQTRVGQRSGFGIRIGSVRKRINPTACPDGVMRVSLRKAPGVRGGTNAARLILIAFTGNDQPDMIVRFSNGDSSDLRAHNLYWARRSVAMRPVRGADSPQWMGDGVSKNGGRKRARRLFGLGLCEKCGEKATDRHHKDDNTANNCPENIAILCRKCHMAVDGRSAKLAAWSPVHNQPEPPKPCNQCTRLYKPLRRGLCSLCYDRLRRSARRIRSASN